MPEREGNGTPLLEARGVSKHFGGLKAVDSVDMRIMPGDIFGIIGPNGAGKTTFFNLCTGIHQPTMGKIFLGGEDITGLPAETVAGKRIARTFQNLQLFKFMTVLENVKAGCHLKTGSNMFDAVLHTPRWRRDEAFTTEKSLEILRRVGLYDVRDVLAGTLSYGMQRKVEIARALALDPVVLLLDEPAAGMNPQEKQTLMAYIRGINQEGHTIVVIEHDMKFIMNACNRILVLNFGRKIFEGTPGEVKANPDVQTAYFGKGMTAREAAQS
ncbi:MAG TPA: ABC transporter ATP-binding protein [Candidatus Limnocylindria bacterium]|nr:ABC transporter ATP-binding protein [Candidatus Limnocylindria bacterium]